MDAIRQLKATHNDKTSSVQVDNIRRMLLSMVEDFPLRGLSNWQSG